jgi:hypothetical protein
MSALRPALAIAGVAVLLIAGWLALGPMVAAAIVLLAFAGWMLFVRRETTALVATVAVIITVVAIPMNRLPSEFSSLRIGALALVAFVTVLVIIRVGITLTMPLVAALVYFVFAAVATSAYPDSNEWDIFALISIASFAGVILSGTIVKLGLWPRVCGLFIAVAVLEALYALVETLADLPHLWVGARQLNDGTSVSLNSELIPGLVRAQGTLAHPLMLALLLTVALALALNKKALPSAPARLLIVVALVGGIAATGSRSALLLAIFLLVFRSSESRQEARLPILLAIVAIAIVLAFPLISPAIDSLMGTGSYTHRLGAIQSVSSLLMREPLSILIGDGSASSIRMFAEGLLQNDGLAAVDNQYVMTFIETGVVGLIIVVGLLVSAFFRASFEIRSVVIVLIVQFSVFDALIWPMSAFIFWFFIGLAHAQSQAERTLDQASVNEPRHTVLSSS